VGASTSVVGSRAGVMQHMEGVQVDYDGITTVEDSTVELLDYIRRLDVECARQTFLVGFYAS
jgi:hypothetical protein